MQATVNIWWMSKGLGGTGWNWVIIWESQTFFPVPLLTHPKQGVSQSMPNWRVLPADPPQALSSHGVRELEQIQIRQSLKC